MTISQLITDQQARESAFPITRERVFLAHAGVAPLPQVAVEAMARFCRESSLDSQENSQTWHQVRAARNTTAQLLHCTPEEIALLGPTSLGLNLVAHGFPWTSGDEVVYYRDDYPANVYPWTSLKKRGVRPVCLRPEYPGVITWDVVEASLTPRTRLVSLASCNFLSGYRIDVDTIGRNLRKRGIYFCLDAIQTLGAFPLSVQYVDFLSADSHKWLLGPCGAGVFYVRETLQDMLCPVLLGSWNVYSPQFVAQDDIKFYEGARRYESGTLNFPGIYGMEASMQFLINLGIERVADRILELRRAFLERVRPLGYRLYLEDYDTRTQCVDDERSGIMALTHPVHDMKEKARNLQAASISVSLRQNRLGFELLRFSPHFYNTEAEFDRVAEILT